jgi:two-component system response regulator
MEEKTILYVEDDPNDEELTLRVLENYNIANRIIVLRDGAEALEYFFPSSENGEANPLPQLVLLDLKLPKVDGLEVLKRIREDERTRLLPVVILTSSSEDQDVIESYNLGANSYVRKPVEFDEFAEAIRRLSMYWLIVNQPPPT